MAEEVGIHSSIPWPASPLLYYRFVDCWLEVSSDNIHWERSPMVQLYPKGVNTPAVYSEEDAGRRPPCVETEVDESPGILLDLL